MTKKELESAVDTFGLCAVLDALAEICYDKEDIIDDPTLVRSWVNAGNKIRAAGRNIPDRVRAGHNDRLPL